MTKKSNVHGIFDGRAILVSTDRVAVYLHGTAAQIIIPENELKKRGENHYFDDMLVHPVEDFIIGEYVHGADSGIELPIQVRT